MDVDAAADLYGLEPGAFVAARDALAKQLRAAGDKDEAARVKALRRPTVAAWALNIAARSEPALVDELLDAAEAARRAHDDVLGGASGDVLREALARRRTAVVAVAQRARAVLDDAGRPSDTQERDIDALLERAVDSTEGGLALRAGALSGVVDREGDTEDLLARLAASVTDRPARPPAKGQAGKAATARPTKGLAAARKERDRRQAAVDAAAEAAADADRDVADAAAALAEASAAHTAAVTARTDKAQALADAQAALAAAEQTVADLEG